MGTAVRWGRSGYSREHRTHTDVFWLHGAEGLQLKSSWPLSTLVIQGMQQAGDTGLKLTPQVRVGLQLELSSALAPPHFAAGCLQPPNLPKDHREVETGANRYTEG